MRATPGRIVNTNDGEGNVIAAMVTRTWSEQDTKSGPVPCDVTLFEPGKIPRPVFGINLFDDRDQADRSMPGSPMAAWWPEKTA